MKILITGSNGLLGQKIIYQLTGTPGVEIIATSKGPNRLKMKEGYAYFPLDISNREEVINLVSGQRPDCIINTAAMTNVDACELDPVACKALNVDAVSHLLEAVKGTECHFIHLSTDFVFDGSAGPYAEDDIPNPQSTYAQSKLDSENIVRASGHNWAIIRTIIIYGVTDDAQRSNLVLWTKSSLEQGKTINVITDQFRSPTLAEDLADACIQAALRHAKGVFHVAGPENEIDSIINLVTKIAEYYQLDSSLIKPVTSAELNQPAKRPRYTGFILGKAERELGYKPHTLREGLKIVSRQLELKEAGPGK